MRATITLLLSGISPTAPASRARTRHGDSQALLWQARKRGPRAAPEARARLLLVHPINHAAAAAAPVMTQLCWCWLMLQLELSLACASERGSLGVRGQRVIKKSVHRPQHPLRRHGREVTLCGGYRDQLFQTGFQLFYQCTEAHTLSP